MFRAGEAVSFDTQAGRIAPRGCSAAKVGGIVIQGGGDYLSRSFGGQNVAIVAANQSGLTGLTVTNPNPSGLWCCGLNLPILYGY